MRNTQGRLGWLIDTRAIGRYVVGAGSVAAGRRYRTVHDITPASLPRWLTTALAPASVAVAAAGPVQLATGRRSGYLNAAIRAETRRVVDAAEGKRNMALYLAAIALEQLVAGGSLSEVEVRAVGDAAAGQIAAGAYTAREAERAVLGKAHQAATVRGRLAPARSPEAMVLCVAPPHPA